MHVELSYFKNITTTTGNQVNQSWAEVVEHLTTFIPREKKDGPLYSPAMYHGTPQRLDMNVVGMSAVVLDFDNTEGTGKNAKPVKSPTLPPDHEDNLGDIAYIWHSTHSNKPDWPKCRLFIPLSRPVSPQEWPAVFQGALAMLGNDPNIDPTCRDLSRSYYLPACPPELMQQSFYTVNDGPAVDPEYLADLAGLPINTEYLPPITGQASASRSEAVSTPGRNNALRQIVAACLERGEAFERIVSEVLTADSKHDPPLFSDTSEMQYQYLSPEVAAIKFVSSIVVSLNRTRGSKGLPPELPYIRSEQAYNAPPVELDHTAKAQEIMALPPEILKPGGFLGQMSAWIEQNAIKSQPVLSLAASIAACAVLMGRKVQTETGLRTNLFIVGIGETSCGKENARQCIKRLFDAANAMRYIGPEEIASDSGLLRAVKSSPAMLLQIDEIGYMLRAVKADAAKSYKADIVPTLMKLDSAASSIMVGRVYADKETSRQDIKQPCVSLYGSSVPCRFLKALTPDEILDGFIPRMVVFESDNPNPRRRHVDLANESPPLTLISRVQTWRDMPTSAKAGNLTGKTGDDETPAPRVVFFSDGARAIFQALEQIVYEEMEKNRTKGYAGLWGKVEAQAMKLALIHACSKDHDTSYINEDSAEWAVSLAIILTRNMVLRAETHIASNQTEGDVKKMLRDVIQAGTEGIKHTELYKRNRKHGVRAFKDHIEALLDQGEILRKELRSPNGKDAKAYVASMFTKIQGVESVS